MKFTKGITFFGLTLLLAALMLSCESREPTTDSAATTADAPTARNGNREFREFADWVQQRSNQADTATEEEWHDMKREFNERSMALEGKTAEWSEETRQEWEQLKADWRETEGKADARLRDDTTTVSVR